MKKGILIGLFVMSIGTLCAQTAYSKEVEEQIKQVENGLAGRVQIEGKETFNIADRMAHYKVKGMSVAVIHNYQMVWAKGYGWADEKEKRPVTTETLFEPGSISKSFNALGILKLAADKKVDLNTDINTYLKSWKFPYDSLSGNKKITLAHLLSHSAGLSVHGFSGYNRSKQIPTLPEILDGKAPANSPAVRSQFEPGKEFQYSGGGTTISQLILTDVTQMPYDKFISENVLKPLGMNNSFFTQPPPADKLNLVATGYREDGSMIPGKFNVYPEQGAAGLWTTPSDLSKYIIETQLAYQGKSAKVLDQKMTKLRLTPYNDPSAALGVFIEERPEMTYFQHGAGNEGFRGFYYGTLEGGDGVVVFVNSDNGDIMFELMNSVATVYKWKSFYKPIYKKEVPVADNLLQSSLGVYMTDKEHFTNIVKKEDGYYLYADGTYSKMYFSSESDFFNVEFPTEKHFVKDATGKITSYERTFEGKAIAPLIKVVNPDTLTSSEGTLNTIGWTFLETKNYPEAIHYLKRGLQLYPKSLVIEGNLAHTYLFSNDYAAALKIYQAHLNDTIDGAYTWKDMIKQDFVYLKHNGFDTAPMDKIFADLKLEIPEGYKE